MTTHGVQTPILESAINLTKYTWADTASSKVPAVTLGFWIIKVLGETGADIVSMTMNLGRVDEFDQA